MNKIIVSVVVATKDRHKLLEKCLDSLVRYPSNNVEIIVVDNSKDNLSKQVVVAYKQIKYVWEKSIGSSYTRNSGVRNAKGKYIAFIDDDSIATKNWLPGIIKFIDNNPGVKVFGGPYKRYSEVKVPEWFPEGFGILNLGRLKRKLKIGNEFLSGTNMVFEKRTIEKVGGFRVDMGKYGNNVVYGEETELQSRLNKKGVDIYYDPKLIVKHLLDPQRVSLRWLLGQSYIAGKSTVKAHGRRDTIWYHIASFAHKSLICLIQLFNPKRMHIKRRIYNSFANLFYAVGAFETYISSKVYTLKK